MACDQLPASRLQFGRKNTNIPHILYHNRIASMDFHSKEKLSAKNPPGSRASSCTITAAGSDFTPSSCWFGKCCQIKRGTGAATPDNHIHRSPVCPVFIQPQALLSLYPTVLSLLLPLMFLVTASLRPRPILARQRS